MKDHHNWLPTFNLFLVILRARFRSQDPTEVLDDRLMFGIALVPIALWRIAIQVWIDVREVSERFTSFRLTTPPVFWERLTEIEAAAILELYKTQGVLLLGVVGLHYCSFAEDVVSDAGVLSGV